MRLFRRPRPPCPTCKAVLVVQDAEGTPILSAPLGMLYLAAKYNRGSLTGPYPLPDGIEMRIEMPK